jgi:signal transduction histidine kinase
MSGARRGGEPGSADPDGTVGPRQADTSRAERTGSARRSALRILILEDDPNDADLDQRHLTSAGLDFTAVVADTRASFVQQLAAFRPEVILSDFSLPGFSGESALKIVQEQCPHIPFIFLSGALGDEEAVELIKQGATDYVLKDRPARLASVIRRAIAEAEQRAQRVQLEAQLRRSQRLESIGRLAGGVAHNFNNLVGIMLNYAAFIRGEAAEKAEKAEPGTDQEAWDSVRRDAEQIEHAGKRVTLLVHQLLTAGSQEVARVELIDLNQVVGGIEDLLRSTIGRQIELYMSLAPQLWPVTADPGQVEQVLLNLAMNARDAMPNGGTFSIETRNLTIDHTEVGRHPGLTPGAYVCLGVRDSGAGMEPHILERAFEPFFTTKPIVEGGGLGLAGVYGIINQAGGTVDISSAPSVGTTITAWLPATLDGEHQQALTSAGQ